MYKILDTRREKRAALSPQKPVDSRGVNARQVKLVGSRRKFSARASGGRIRAVASVDLIRTLGHMPAATLLYDRNSNHRLDANPGGFGQRVEAVLRVMHQNRDPRPGIVGRTPQGRRANHAVGPLNVIRVCPDSAFGALRYTAVHITDALAYIALDQAGRARGGRRRRHHASRSDVQSSSSSSKMRPL